MMRRRHFRPGGWGSVTTTDDPRRALLGTALDPGIDGAVGALVAAIERYAATVAPLGHDTTVAATAQLCARLRSVVGSGGRGARVRRPDGIGDLRLLCRLVVQLAPHVDPSHRVALDDATAVTFASGLAAVVAEIEAAT